MKSGGATFVEPSTAFEERTATSAAPLNRIVDLDPGHLFLVRYLETIEITETVTDLGIVQIAVLRTTVSELNVSNVRPLNQTIQIEANHQ